MSAEPVVPGERDVGHYARMERLFWLKVWPRGDCWEWRGYLTQAGYGLYTAYGISYRAHRLAYTWTKGWIPLGLVIDHLCNHPWCVKPSHLVTVTGRQNTLRGVGPSACNARKTHCKHGHEFTKENIVANKADKWRECRTCHNADITRLRRAAHRERRSA